MYYPFKTCHITRYFSSIKPMEDMFNTRQRWSHTTIYNNKIQLHLSQFQCRNSVVLIPPQNMVKILRHILRVEIYSFSEGQYGDIAITIMDVIFNLDWWFRGYVVLNLYPPRRYICKTWINTITVIWKLGLYTSPDSNTVISERLVVTI